MTKNNSESTNILFDIHECFINSAILFRKEVCKECDWSIPTYYRKVRSVDKPNQHFKDKIIPALSNAEKAGILRKAKLVAQEINDFMNKF